MLHELSRELVVQQSKDQLEEYSLFEPGLGQVALVELEDVVGYEGYHAH